MQHSPMIQLGSVALLCLLCSALCLKRSRHDALVDIDIKHRGIKITGSIIRHQVIPGHEKRCYALIYGYSHRGRTYQQEQRVNRTTFRTLQDGDAVEVHYFPYDPEVAVLTTIPKIHPLRPLMVVFFTLACIFGIPCLVFLLIGLVWE